jgi:hypothetical protein
MIRDANPFIQGPNKKGESRPRFRLFLLVLLKVIVDFLTMLIRAEINSQV